MTSTFVDLTFGPAIPKNKRDDVCTCIDLSHTSTPDLLNMADFWPDVRLCEESRPASELDLLDASGS